MTRIVAFWPFLELVTGDAGAAGETETASRTAARSPPPTRAGGQDDGSYTNSLKLERGGGEMGGNEGQYESAEHGQIVLAHTHAHRTS